MANYRHAYAECHSITRNDCRWEDSDCSIGAEPIKDIEFLASSLAELIRATHSRPLLVVRNVNILGTDDERDALRAVVLGIERAAVRSHQ